MFDLPETKRVRRNELFSPLQSREASPSSAALELDLDFVTVAPADPQAQQGGEGDNGGLDFQLFSTATRGKQQKVTLKEPTPPPSDEDAWELLAKTQKRPEDYYVLSEEDMAVRRKALGIEEVVVEGEEIIKAAGVIWPGCRVPHKVITITMPPAPPIIKKSEKKSKPGKKRRIHLRKAQQKIKAAEEARLKSIEGRKKYAGLSKEERDKREREDRNKRNREKKIKRRIREKAKKEAVRAATGVIAEGGVDNGSDSGSDKGMVDVEKTE